MRFGAIDIGTNSIHLIVVELDPQFGASQTVLKAREMVRLGADDALAAGRLSRKAMLRGAAAIAEFERTARDAGAIEIRAVATSAVREAKNRSEFASLVRAQSGVAIEVLSEIEEARLIHLGVSRGFPLGDRIGCIIDIGGGSTEFIIADKGSARLLISAKLGSLRLFDEFLRDRADARAYRTLVRHIRAELAPLVPRLLEHDVQLVIGTSGTFMGLASLDAADLGAMGAQTHGYELALPRLHALQRIMLRATPGERRKLPGMNPRRSDIIVAGNAIAITALEMLGKQSATVCERALREGIVVDFLQRNAVVAQAVSSEVSRRRAVIREFARRFGADTIHEAQVAELGYHLFDQLAGVHGLQPADRELLGAAAILHDVGRAVNVSAHHKHSAYLVASAALPGWRREEQEILAAVVRYHRKALPKPSHPEWAALNPAARIRVEKLAALLRIADALDVRRLGAVTGIQVKRSGTDINIKVRVERDAAPEIEAARAKSDLFARAFGMPPVFRVTS